MGFARPHTYTNVYVRLPEPRPSARLLELRRDSLFQSGRSVSGLTVTLFGVTNPLSIVSSSFGHRHRCWWPCVVWSLTLFYQQLRPVWGIAGNSTLPSKSKWIEFDDFVVFSIYSEFSVRDLPILTVDGRKNWSPVFLTIRFDESQGNAPPVHGMDSP